MKLNKEAIDEITYLLKEVKDVVKLLGDFGIHITSDPWTATSFCDKEHILVWDKKDFSQFNCIQTGDKFFIGGNIITGAEYEYKGKWINAPKKLAKVQGEIFEEYLKPISKFSHLKHFDLEFVDQYGLVNNCGWEHYLCIEATVKPSALTESSTQKLINDIKKEYGYDYIYTAFNDDCSDITSVNNLKGYDKKYACMIEIFSELADPSNFEKSELTGDFTDDFIDRVIKIRQNMVQLEMEVKHHYEDKGVDVTLSKWNVGCQYGMAMYIWIPYQ